MKSVRIKPTPPRVPNLCQCDLSCDEGNRQRPCNVHMIRTSMHLCTIDIIWIPHHTLLPERQTLPTNETRRKR